MLLYSLKCRKKQKAKALRLQRQIKKKKLLPKCAVCNSKVSRFIKK